MAIVRCPEKYSIDVFIDNRNKIKQLFAEREKDNKIKKFRFFKNLIDSTRDTLRNFPKIIKILLTRRRKNTVYVAAIFYDGLGDMVRYKSAVLELVKMNPDIIIDIYNKSSQPIFKDMRNVRFFLNIDAVNLIKRYYDVVYMFDFFTAYPMLMKKGLRLTDKISENLLKYKEKYAICFDKFHTYELIENGINVINLLKITSGVDNIEDISFNIKPKELPLTKFGIDDNTLYLTFQCGAGGSGNSDDPKCWSLKSWEKLLSILKVRIGNKIKFIQVGTGNHYISGVDINLSGKTSLDELFCVLNKSLFHIDIDGACSHFTRALGTKSLIIFGPTDGFFSCYPENINVISSLCNGCWTSSICPLGYDKILCMESITPEFVADKVVEQIELIMN
jgi:ADP-heptose:LPS heptosyltransferase